jgi:plasmid stabilization system protein ParE
MTLPLRVEAEASDEVEHAVLWYERRRAGLGVEFLQAVDRALKHIQEWLRSGATVRLVEFAVPIRQIPVPRFPYHVVYLETSEAIRVLALAHDHRLPGFWRERL